MIVWDKTDIFWYLFAILLPVNIKVKERWNNNILSFIFIVQVFHIQIYIFLYSHVFKVAIDLELINSNYIISIQ